jgi:AraC-like DNA-binding protein
MEILNIAFHLFSFMLALLASALLLFVNQERRHSNHLLAFVLITFAFQNLMLILLFSKLMLKVPWLLRVFAPTTFLLGPAAYLYVRSVLNDELKFKKHDWMLLIPAVLVIINFIPYYILPAHEKVNFLSKNFYGVIPNQDSGRGILPNAVYYLLRVVWSGAFLYLGFRLIIRFRKKASPEVYANNKALLKWLFTFFVLLTTILFAALLKVLIPPIKNTQLTIADLFLAATLVFVCLQLFIRPQILYGVYQPISLTGRKIFGEGIRESNGLTSQVIAEVTTPLDPGKMDSIPVFMREEQLRHKLLIEKLFFEKRPYLQLDYDLEQMGIDTNMQRNVLSAFINKEYGVGFREFINRYRVNYFKDNLNNPLWNTLTLEAIAEECGFQSRSTFINNFKKITGQTPSEYLKIHTDNTSKSVR